MWNLFTLWIWETKAWRKGETQPNHNFEEPSRRTSEETIRWNLLFMVSYLHYICCHFLSMLWLHNLTQATLDKIFHVKNTRPDYISKWGLSEDRKVCLWFLKIEYYCRKMRYLKICLKWTLLKYTSALTMCTVIFK